MHVIRESLYRSSFVAGFVLLVAIHAQASIVFFFVFS